MLMACPAQDPTPPMGQAPVDHMPRLTLEGTSVSLALMAAEQIQKPLQRPDAAFSYLRSHGTLDLEHVAHFQLLMDQIEDPADQADNVHGARAFFRLYGDVFRSLPLPRQQAAAAAMPTAPGVV